MRLKCISNKRGIYFLYDGTKYVIYSEYYGVVAESTSINREEENKVYYHDKYNNYLPLTKAGRFVAYNGKMANDLIGRKLFVEN